MWGREEDLMRIGKGSIDVVVASELLYPAITTPVVHALFTTVDALLSPSPSSCFLLSFIPRDGYTSIKKMIGAATQTKMTFEKIDEDVGVVVGGEGARVAKNLGGLVLCFRRDREEEEEEEEEEKGFEDRMVECVRRVFPRIEEAVEEEEVEVWEAPFIHEEEEEEEEEGGKEEDS